MTGKDELPLTIARSCPPPPGCVVWGCCQGLCKSHPWHAGWRCCWLGRAGIEVMSAAGGGGSSSSGVRACSLIRPRSFSKRCFSDCCTASLCSTCGAVTRGSRWKPRLRLQGAVRYGTPGDTWPLCPGGCHAARPRTSCTRCSTCATTWRSTSSAINCSSIAACDGRGPPQSRVTAAQPQPSASAQLVSLPRVRQLDYE